MADGSRGIQSIEISGRILHALVAACEPVMLKDLAQAANLVPAQCHAYLTSLRHAGLVHQDEHTGRYLTGPFAIRLAICWLGSTAIFNKTIEGLKALTDELGVISLLAIWGQSGPTIIHVNRGLTASGLNIRHGTLFSVTGSATGRVFAAFDDRDVVRDLINAELSTTEFGPAIGSRASRQEFEKLVRETQKFGFAVAKGRPIPDANAVSVPIFNEDGSLASVGSLIGESDVLSLEEGSIAIQKLTELVKRISNFDGAMSEAGS